MTRENDVDTPAVTLPVEPLGYQTELVRYLQMREAELWSWFCADRLREQNNAAVRLDLLKATYRIDRDANPVLYGACDEVMASLNLSCPVTFYQSSGGSAMNASLAYMPGEAHIVFTGPVLTTLTPTELKCVLGHELMHFALLDRWREYLVATQMLSAMCNDVQAQPAHAASARLLRLYTEVCCDRAAYQATKDLWATITALVRIETGTADVAAESYLRQTDEIFAKGHPRAEGVTHPETFIRARALKLWVENPQTAGDEIAHVIEGVMALEELDLLGQQRVSETTRRLIGAFLRAGWLRTEAELAHARLFFEDFKPAAAGIRFWKKKSDRSGAWPKIASILMFRWGVT